MPGDEFRSKVCHLFRSDAALGDLLLRLRVTPSRPLGQDPLGLDAGLLRRRWAILADSVLTRIVAVARRPALDEEDLATCGSNLHAKALQIFIPPDPVTIGRVGQGIKDALGELASGNDGWSRARLPE